MNNLNLKYLNYLELMKLKVKCYGL